MVILTLFAPLVTAISGYLIGKPALRNWVTGIGALTTFVSSLILTWQVLTGEALTAMDSWLYIDAFSAYLLVIIGLIGLIATLYSIDYMQHEVEIGMIGVSQLATYYLLFNIFIFTMVLTVMANNLGLLWIAIEATTLASAMLVGFYKQKGSLEAAWKYIILCTVGIAFALLGVILTYYAASQIESESVRSLQWTFLMANKQQLDPQVLKLAFVFILIGFGTKAGLAPLHHWLPDAHSQAPSPVSAVLSGVLLNCALYGVIRYHLLLSQIVGSQFSGNLLLIFGLISMAIAVPFISLQHDLKRLLAYSSVEHMGIIAAGIGLGGKLALYGASLHFLNHAVAKSLLFFSAGSVTQHYGTRQMARIRGAITALPFSGVLLLLGSLAITGVPPFSIFVSEFSIITGGFAQGKYLASGLFLLFIALVFAGFMYHILQMVLGLKPDRVKVRRESWLTVTAMGIPIVLIVVLGLYIPSLLDNMLSEVLVILGGGR
ncbi:hydrogenase 4 subunit F [Metallumcola ferriviriculae]|uniref:Hydrogenase 4 subunit F n=1 Tax=Metallumcola ferriviriculae TaxID=3039180 RepID=A0AAU0UKH9_9FIRM|nr:hydrogenase 4 subunit F [Desulfitibacteraceae bacterium MK1]